MPAYVLSEVRSVDEEAMTRYRALAAPSIAQHGGRYLARGVSPQAAEGAWPDDQSVVLVEFDSLERIQAWYQSAEYAPAFEVRRTALERRLLFFAG